MRILLVSQELPPETGWGGIGTYISLLAPALVAGGHEVHVLSVVPGQARATRTTAEGVVVHRAPLTRPRGVGRLTGLRETWHRLSLAWSVAREVSRLGGFDVIECPEWNAEGFVLARRRPAPLVVRSHSSAAQILPFFGHLGLDARWAIRLEDDTLRRADLVTGTRAQLEAEAARLGLPQDRLRVVPLPVRPPPIEGRVAISGERVLFVGRFETRKGPDTVLRAFPSVRRAVPEARLVLVGRDGSEPNCPSFAARLRDLARALGVADAVEVRDGWSAREVVAREMAASAVCVVPSRWESFGLVAAEASALGRPVVASALPALAEVVVDGVTGRLVPSEDAEAWAAALVDVLSNRSRAETWGRAGAARMEAHHRPERVAEETLAAYEVAIARRRAPSRRESAPALQRVEVER